MGWRIWIAVWVGLVLSSSAHADEVARLYGEARRVAQANDRLTKQRTWLKKQLDEGRPQAARTMAADFRVARSILSVDEWQAVQPRTAPALVVPELSGRMPRHQSVTAAALREAAGDEARAVQQRIDNLLARQTVLLRQVQALVRSAQETEASLAETTPYVDAASDKLEKILQARRAQLAGVKQTGQRLQEPATRQFHGREADRERSRLQALINQIERVESDIRSYGATPASLDGLVTRSPPKSEAPLGDVSREPVTPPAVEPAPAAEEQPAPAAVAKPAPALAERNAPRTRSDRDNALLRAVQHAQRRDAKRMQGARAGVLRSRLGLPSEADLADRDFEGAASPRVKNRQMRGDPAASGRAIFSPVDDRAGARRCVTPSKGSAASRARAKAGHR